jgi:CPA2 family monovalent cation:H+ antiporter-2
MSHIIFLQDLAIVMAASAVVTVVFHRLRIPTVLGYLLVGLLIGPNLLAYSLVNDLHDIQTMSELGIVFLLFAIGLEFSITKLLKVGPAALLVGLIEIPMMIAIGYKLGGLFGWKPIDCLFLGAIISISSTTIIAKVLVDLKILHERFTHMILGILIVEDLIAILIIALLSAVAATGHMTLHEAGLSVMRVMTFVVGATAVTAFVVPKALSYVERRGSQETLTITVLALALGASLLAVRAGFSAALGAFLMGAVIAETSQARDIVRKIEPLRDMFTAVFFVSVGMTIDPALVVRYAVPIGIIALVTIVGKITFCSLGAFLTGHSAQNSLKVGLGLAQIGEFSFILAKLGQSLGVTAPFLYPIAVSVSAITALTTPVMMRHTSVIVRVMSRLVPARVATFAGFYTSWLNHVGGVRFEGDRAGEIWKGVLRYLPRIVFYVVIGAVLYFASQQLRGYFGWQPSIFFWLAVGTVMFPVLLGLAHTLDRICWNVIFLNLWKADGHMNPSGEAGRGVHNVFRFMMMVGVGIILLAVGSFFNPAPPMAVGVVGLIIAAGALLWSSVRELHEKVERVILGVFDPESGEMSPRSQAAQSDLIKMIHEQYPWGVETLDFVVPFSPSALNQSLRDLALRVQTGVSVVAIYRNEESIPNPEPSTLIQPGDVLLLMGDKEQIRQAHSFLQKKALEEPLSR